MLSLSAIRTTNFSLLYRRIAPGLAVVGLVAIAAQFLSEHYGAPAMLMALLLGLALNFLSEDGTRTQAGIEYSAKYILRIGIALLGIRISVETLTEVGVHLIVVILLGAICTIAVGLLGARILGYRRSFGLLTGCSVAICGASAAMAVAAIIPEREKDERDVLFTVLVVTLFSTLAMIFYPMLTAAMGLEPRMAGVFLGGTIHDVAQVIGAGFSLGPETGEFATLIKLIRVAMLAPVVLTLSIYFSRSYPAESAKSTGQPILPGFIIGFLILALINSTLTLPEPIKYTAGFLSQVALLAAIAAVGMKTSLRRILTVGKGAIFLILAETLFLAVFVLVALYVFG